MTTTTRATIALLAFAGAAAISTSVHAATTTASEGDVLLGIRSTAAGYTTNSYLIDLGSVSNFVNYTSAQQFQLTLSDITTAVGSFSSTTFWGAAAESGVLSSVIAGVPTATVFATSNSATSPWLSGNTTTNNGACTSVKNTTIGSGASGFTGQTATATLSNATLEPNSASKSWQNGVNLNNLGVSWGYLAPAAEASFADGAGSATSRLNFYEIFRNGALMPDGSTAVTGVTPGVLLGTFDINSSALVTYTPATPAPEPSTFALLGLGAGLFGVIRRRSAKV